MTFGNFSRALSEHALDEEPVPEVPVKFLSSGLPARGLEKALGKTLSPVSCFQNGGPVERSFNCSETSQVTL